MPEPNTESMSSLCLAVSSIATRKRQANDDDFLVDFNQQGTHFGYRLMAMSNITKGLRCDGWFVVGAVFENMAVLIY